MEINIPTRTKPTDMRTYVSKDTRKKASYNVLHEDFIALSRYGTVLERSLTGRGGCVVSSNVALTGENQFGGWGKGGGGLR